MHSLEVAVRYKMGDEKKPKPGLLDFIGWKDWAIPDDWTAVARDRTEKSVSFLLFNLF